MAVLPANALNLLSPRCFRALDSLNSTKPARRVEAMPKYQNLHTLIIAGLHLLSTPSQVVGASQIFGDVFAG